MGFTLCNQATLIQYAASLWDSFHWNLIHSVNMVQNNLGSFSTFQLPNNKHNTKLRPFAYTKKLFFRCFIPTNWNHTWSYNEAILCPYCTSHRLDNVHKVYHPWQKAPHHPILFLPIFPTMCRQVMELPCWTDSPYIRIWHSHVYLNICSVFLCFVTMLIFCSEEDANLSLFFLSSCPV